MFVNLVDCKVKMTFRPGLGGVWAFRARLLFFGLGGGERFLGY